MASWERGCGCSACWSARREFEDRIRVELAPYLGERIDETVKDEVVAKLRELVEQYDYERNHA